MHYSCKKSTSFINAIFNEGVLLASTHIVGKYCQNGDVSYWGVWTSIVAAPVIITQHSKLQNRDDKFCTVI